ncbi:MAG: T9SS type A sorting domain-containing protein [Calditrichia bacterium]
MRNATILIILLLLLLNLTLSANPMGNGPWSTMGPYAAIVDHIAIDPFTGQEFACLPSAGVYKNENGLFVPSNNGIIFEGQQATANSMAFSDWQPGLALAGIGAEIYRTTDHGENWQFTGLVAQGIISGIQFMNEDVIFAFSLNEVYRSLDAGQNWLPVNCGLSDLNDMEVDTANQIIYANSYSKIMRSMDGGNSWHELPFPGNAIHELYVGPSSGKLYIVADSLYRSDNPGLTWEGMKLPPTYYTVFTHRLCEDAINDTLLYMGNLEGAYRWSVSRQQWEDASNGLIEVQMDTVHAPIVTNLTSHPNIEGRVYAGTYQAGLYVSDDGAQSWSLASLPGTRIDDIALGTGNTTKLIAANYRGVRMHENGVWRRTPLFADIGFDCRTLAVSPKDSNLILTGGKGAYTDNARLHMSHDGGQTWDHVLEVYGAVTFLSVAIHPLKPNIMYAGCLNPEISAYAGLYRTYSGGVTDTSWTALQQSFLWHIGAVGISPDDYAVYAVDIYGAVYKSIDEGMTFQLMGTASANVERYVTRIVFDPMTNLPYITGDGVSVSVDGGASWQVLGLQNHHVTDLAFDPNNLGRMFAATNGNGVFESADGGMTWSPMHHAIPHRWVSALEFDNNERKLYAATSGGSIYTCDISAVPSGLEDEKPAVAMNFNLEQNYPNPFNPQTTIRYQLPVSGRVMLKVYNSLGQEIATLVDGFQNSGENTVRFDGANLPSGIYYYQLSCGEFAATRKMILMK